MGTTLAEQEQVWILRIAQPGGSMEGERCAANTAKQDTYLSRTKAETDKHYILTATS